MTAEESSLRAQVLACKAICNLCHNPHVRAFLLRGGKALARLQVIATKYFADIKLVGIFLRTITNISYHSNTNKHILLSSFSGSWPTNEIETKQKLSLPGSPNKIIHQNKQSTALNTVTSPRKQSTPSSSPRKNTIQIYAHGSGCPLIDFIFKCIEFHGKTSVPIVADGLVVLRNLLHLNKDSLHPDIPPATLYKMYLLLEEYSEFSTIKSSIFWILTLIMSDRPEMKLLFNATNGITRVIKLLTKKKDDDLVCLPAAIVLGLVAKMVQIRKNFNVYLRSYYPDGNAGPLGQILCRSRDRRVKRAVFKLFFRLSFMDHMRAYFGKGQVIPWTIQVTSDFPFDYPLIRISALFLRSLAKSELVSENLAKNHRSGILGIIEKVKWKLGDKVAMELKPLSDITTGVMKEERRKEMERREALMLKEKKEELETLVFHELEVSDREGSLAIENTMKMPEGDEREPLKPMEIKKTLSREGERTMTEQKREEGGDIIEGETRSVAEKESCEKTIHALREKQQQESVLRKQRQEFMQQEKDKTDTVLQGERKKQEQVLEAKLEKTRSEKRLIEKKLEEELEGMEEIRRRRREEAKDALVKAQQLKMLEQQQKEEKERLERMARREEQRLKEEQRKLLFERKISEARKKREEKREERELLIANEARRVMEMKKKVHEKEEKMIEELVERKKLRSQELSKQFKVQEEELKRLTIQFAAKMYQKNEEYNVGRMQKMLERVPKKKNCTKIHVRNTWIPNKELLTTKNSIKISRNFKRITRNF
eukprot:TRINITY_DN8502_c0_g1_i16.p1 TRINITY_DN8502_c0_g1~~TRINITY_DN8502_c0_g1_i16.p1  ORF type:complete len:904 (-),score=233.05 TRINITY_DN8502_c0_g1_i16:634-2943(-)